jgi:hypothetical protein
VNGEAQGASRSIKEIFMKKIFITLAIVAGLVGATFGLGYVAEQSIPAAQACGTSGC